VKQASPAEGFEVEIRHTNFIHETRTSTHEFHKCARCLSSSRRHALARPSYRKQAAATSGLVLQPAQPEKKILALAL
jgi:hypothetical protein